MSEENKNQNNGEEIEESNLAKRLRSLEGETKETENEIIYQPKTIAEKISNYWYHFKWPTIIASFFVIFAIFCIIQMSTRQNPDLYIMYTGPISLSPEGVITIQDSFETFDKDYNSDGKHVVSLLDIVAMTDAQMDKLREESIKQSQLSGNDEVLDFNKETIRNARQRFSNEIIAGESVICLLDPNMYEMVRDSGAFMTLSEVFGENIPDTFTAYDEYAVSLASTSFGKNFAGVKELPSDTLICIRRPSIIGSIMGKSKAEAKHTYHLDIFKAILSYESSDSSVQAN